MPAGCELRRLSLALGGKIQVGPLLDFIWPTSRILFGFLPTAQLLLENKKKKKRKGDRGEKSGGGFRARWVSGQSLKASAECNGSWHTQVLSPILPSQSFTAADDPASCPVPLAVGMLEVTCPLCSHISCLSTGDYWSVHRMRRAGGSRDEDFPIWSVH